MKFNPVTLAIGVGVSLVVIGIWQNPWEWLAATIGTTATVGVWIIFGALTWAWLRVGRKS